MKVSEKAGWDYKKEYQEAPNSMRVIQKRIDDGFTLTDEFYTEGVVPVGFSVAREILGKALKECGLRDVNLRSVIP